MEESIVIGSVSRWGRRLMIARTRPAAPPRIGLDSAGLLMTPEEFDAIEEYDDRYRYELIDGVLVVNPIPLEGESGPNELLGGLLFGYREYHEHGHSLDRTLQERFVRTANGRRRADRIIWAGFGRPIDPEVDPPSIIVEFVSRSRRDRRRDYEQKREEYSQTGVKEYWIIDRFERRMTVFKFGGRRTRATIVTEKETYSSRLLPGFDLPLASILEEADYWDKPK
jgi:Uma2 family endonuclease